MNLILVVSDPSLFHSQSPVSFSRLFSILSAFKGPRYENYFRPNHYWTNYEKKPTIQNQTQPNGNLKTYLPMTGLLFLFVGLGGGMGGCLAGTVLGRLGVAVVLVLAGEAGRVLGTGEGRTGE